MRKFFLPAVIVLIGAGTAFASHLAKNNSKAIVAGYRIVSLGGGQFSCENADKDCSDVETGPICTWSDGLTSLKQFDTPTMCGETLHEIEP
ncbi:hypothetical protein A0O34_07215 [Chryseobacterium glaciei]|uniref:Uncharacterized protein n=1 Tax=Chryseobacterium glaciei TaxID=1685010 RepID=A0A172XTS8_9FLAO|nr:DUF6520 family protein [Chryseobacterium glaciei]ANF50316.1 hypothetical protein A0O34_07215 [Chryseobacterium glaciei]